MGDFESTFGAGADAVSIIEGLSRRDARDRPADDRPRPKVSEIYCESFESASALAKSHPGSILRREYQGERFVVDFGEMTFAIEIPLPDGFVEPVWDKSKKQRSRKQRSREDYLIEAKDDSLDSLGSAICTRWFGVNTLHVQRVPPPPSEWIKESIARDGLVFKPLTRRISLIVGAYRFEGGVLLTEPGRSVIVNFNGCHKERDPNTPWFKDNISPNQDWYTRMMRINWRGEHVR